MVIGVADGRLLSFFRRPPDDTSQHTKEIGRHDYTTQKRQRYWDPTMTPVRGGFQSNADTCETEIEDGCCENRYDEAKGVRLMPDGGDLTKRWGFLQLHRKQGVARIKGVGSRRWIPQVRKYRLKLG
jgi:hypothetical protein